MISMYLSTVLLFVLFGSTTANDGSHASDQFSVCLLRSMFNSGDVSAEDFASVMTEYGVDIGYDGLESFNLETYWGMLSAVDCAEVQNAIDSVIASDDPDLLNSYMKVALLEEAHKLGQAENGGAERRNLFLGSAPRNGETFDQWLWRMCCEEGRDNFPWCFSAALVTLIAWLIFLSWAPLERHWHPFRPHLDSVEDSLHSNPVTSAGKSILDFLGRRTLSNTDVTITPVDVMEACANGAPSTLCSFNLAELAAELSLHLCGGATVAMACVVSPQNVQDAIERLAIGN